MKLIPSGSGGEPLLRASVYVVTPSPPVAAGSVWLVIASFCAHDWFGTVPLPNVGSLSSVIVMLNVELAVSPLASVTVYV